MNTKLTLKVIMLTILSQLLTTPSVTKAQSGGNGMVNAFIDANGALHINSSKSSSKNDFDFFDGKWEVTSRILKTRLNHNNEWITCKAKNDVSIILGGIGNTDRYYAQTNRPNFEGATFRLFNPKTKLWSLYWADSERGTLDVPVVGSFENNVGWFYAKDTFNGKDIIEVFKWDKTDPDKPVWSQAFSTDNGKTWEWNWYMNFEKAGDGAKDPEVSENQSIKVLELRNYILKQRKRDEFINYFEKHFFTSQNILGGYVLGQFRIKNADNRFLWFRGFNDMMTRSVFLPEFYRKSLVWKKFGPGANDLLEDNDDVYLLRPLNDISSSGEQSKGISTNDFAKHKGIVVIDYHTANEGQLDQLISWYASLYKPYLQSIGIINSTLWISELSQNDYPSLPVIQDKNLLVAITFYKDEADYNSKLKLIEGNTELQSKIKKLIKGTRTMIVYPTEKSFGETSE